MKKFLFLLSLIAIFFVGCNTHSSVNNKQIPLHYVTLEFYNGGMSIAKFSDVDMQIEIITTTKVMTNNINFYRYHIYSKEQHISEYIIDSEALSYKYTIEEF